MTDRTVLCCGSRTFTDRACVEMVLNGLLSFGDIAVVHGGAQGADTVAGVVASDRDLSVLVIDAAWGTCVHNHPDVPCPPGNQHRRRSQRYTLNSSLQDETYCPLAGPRRNADMLRVSNPDLVIAFVDKPIQDPKGTRDMVDRARQASVPVYIIEAYQ